MHNSKVQGKKERGDRPGSNGTIYYYYKAKRGRASWTRIQRTSVLWVDTTFNPNPNPNPRARVRVRVRVRVTLTLPCVCLFSVF
jgi:hypothetical protein